MFIEGRDDCQGRPGQLVLRYADVRSYVLTAVFVLGGVFLPWVFHQFALAGPTFLPMQFLILIAGLTFGWRAGLIIGLLTPIVSYSLSGMPVLYIMPQTVVELAVYGLVAGQLRERLHQPVLVSLLGAMVCGRLALLLFVALISLVAGGNTSFLGAEANPFAVIVTAVRQGWPGMMIQVIIIPAIVWIVRRRANDLEDRP